MKTNLDFKIKKPINTNISLFFSNHYFQNRRTNKNISATRAIKNISINHVKSIIKPHLDTLVKHKGRYLFTIYTDSTQTNKAYFLIVSENQNIEGNALNFVVVSAGTSSNLNVKFKNIFAHNRFFITDFTCEDLINQDRIKEEKLAAIRIENKAKLISKRKSITRVDKSSAMSFNLSKVNINSKSTLQPARTYKAISSDNHFTQIENRFLAIEKRLKKIHAPLNVSKNLTVNYLNYLEYLLTTFAKNSLSEGSYKNIITTCDNLRELLTNKVAA